MRTKYATATFITSKVTAYNKKTKTEESFTVESVEGVEPVNTPDPNLVELSREEVSRKEKRLKMSPETFIKYAEVVSE